MKTCFKCLNTLSLTEFYKHSAMKDGRLNKRKACTKRDVSNRLIQLKNDPIWITRERARCRDKQSSIRALGLAAPTTQATRKKWAEKNPHKIKAHKAVSRAIRSGKIQPRYSCEKCGSIGKRLEKHHEDYSKPLQIQWLCAKCHGITRRKP